MYYVYIYSIERERGGSSLCMYILIYIYIYIHKSATDGYGVSGMLESAYRRIRSLWASAMRWWVLASALHCIACPIGFE